MEPVCIRELPNGVQSPVEFVTSLDRAVQPPVLPTVTSVFEDFLGAEPMDGVAPVLTLVADAGFGKSSALLQLGARLMAALQAYLDTPQAYAQRDEDTITTPWIPVLVELKRYSVSDLVGLLPRLLTVECGLPREVVDGMRSPQPGQLRVRILLLCDGVDELPGIETVSDLAATLCGPGWSPQVIKVITTCRATVFQHLGEERRVFGDGYTRWLLLPFCTSQVRLG